MASIITLTTDFGLADEYVAVMKGVILARTPAARLVDISHQIRPQDVAQAAFTLAAAVPYFPEGSVHLAVVDPGVGSSRRIVALRAMNRFFVGPDNGIFSPFLVDDHFEACVVVDCPSFYCEPVSNTFHGRDIMAPVAAALARGIPLADIGPTVFKADLKKLVSSQLQIDPISGNITGAVVQIDQFGNLTTNIHQRDIARLTNQPDKIKLFIKTTTISGLADCYEDAEDRGLIALIGSRGFLEIAANRGNAAAMLAVAIHEPVQVVKRPG